MKHAFGDRARFLVLRAGEGLLAVLGLLLLLVPLASGGGVALVVISVPILLAALSLFLGWKWARAVGATLAALYALAIGYVATTPWRGLTPAEGQAREPLELGLVGVTIAFTAAAVFIAIGKVQPKNICERSSSDGPP